MQVHDGESAVLCGRGLHLQRQPDLPNPNLRKEQPAQAIESGRLMGEPCRSGTIFQSRVRKTSASVLSLISSLNTQRSSGEDLMKVGLYELFASDVREDDAVPERHDGLALERVTRRM